jgi:hypothetical protein
MQCSSCGRNFDQPVKFCPDCGAPVQPAVQTPLTQAPAGQAYIRADYDPTRDGRPAAHAYSPPPVQPAGYAAPPVQRPSSTGMIVFAIVNTLCCGVGFSFVLGIIALVFAIMSSSETTFEGSVQKLKTARILNFIGLGFIILQVVITVILVIGSLFFASWSGEFQNFNPYSFDPNFFNNFYVQ